MKERLLRLWNWFHSSDPATWQGHLHIGLAGFWPGYWLGSTALGLPVLLAGAVGILTGFVLIAGVFAYREGDNIIAGVKEFGLRLAMRRKGLDGFLDFWMPVMGVGCDINLLRGGFGDFIAAYLFTQGVWAMCVIAKRMRER